ncbi:hypothetical protein L6R53_22670, partial [Myxococcota bacterium]|nr:hypothetical protein [Myxococcota bacterium]
MTHPRDDQPTALDAILGEFADSTPTVQAVRSVLEVAAWGPTLPSATSLATLAQRPWVPQDPAVLARAAELSQQDRVAEALRVGRAVDEGDDLVDVRTGIDTALAIYRSVRDGGSPLAPLRERQERDAVFKLLGLGDVAWRLFGGQPMDRVRALLSLESGVALVSWVGAVEIALPFLMLNRGHQGGVLRPLAEKHRESEEGRLAGLVGRAAVDGAAHTAGNLLSVLDGVAQANAKRLDFVAKVAGGLLDAASGPLAGMRKALSSGVDVLPVYRMLTARVAAEACLRQAVAELHPGTALPQPPYDLVGLMIAP